MNHVCGFCYQDNRLRVQPLGMHFVLTYCGMRWLCDDCLKTN